jgi:hypothetical protein
LAAPFQFNATAERLFQLDEQESIPLRYLTYAGFISKFLPASSRLPGESAGGPMRDAALKRLMKDLGEAINESLSESPKINDCIQSIRDTGYDVFVVIEAKIGVNRKSDEEQEVPVAPEKSDEPVRLRITSEDAKFLKSLKIAVDADKVS